MIDRVGWRPHFAFGGVLAVLAIGMIRIIQYNWREGTAIIGGALLIAAVLRVLLPAQQAGLLAIRGRVVDALTYTAFGLAMLAVSLTIVGGPLAEA